MRTALSLALAAALLAAATPALAQGRILIVNTNDPGVGFNDPTPAAPVGGNPGTTLGEQRLNVFLHAAAIWEEALHPTNDVLVNARFVPLAPNVLGSAGATFIFRDFAGAELPGTWYPSALADQLAGVDLNPGFADISTNFSTNFQFYLGFDHQEGALQDLLAVVLHELGHGLGFANFVNEVTGTFASGRPDVYSQYTLDVTTGLIWNEMTDEERRTSAVNVRKVSWNGHHVNAAAPGVLARGEPYAAVKSRLGSGPIMVGPASFGPALTAAGVRGDLVLGDDGVDATADACTPFPARHDGKIVLVDRGTCAFAIKVKNAQDAGAVAVLVADNAAGSPPVGLGGADATITIPSARITVDDGARLREGLAAGPVTATLGVDRSVKAGTDRVEGLVMLASLQPVAPGSSISHFEAIATRNLLMEPAINPDLGSSLRPPEDLTLELMKDIGWFSDADGVPDGADRCLGSDTRASLLVGACDTGVANRMVVDGCWLGDALARCGEAGAWGHAACVANVADLLLGAGAVTESEKAAILSCN